ncbi:MAG: YigZ family protein [Defluviitaleaceae bacterium]|nr:YigZ family protein [Defluviitaleaceae bacterium]
MIEKYTTLYEEFTTEIIIKKSRFIATAFKADTENELVATLTRLKREYNDANHNVFAYTTGLTQKILRQSDDGEPSGTAGKPALEVIKSLELTNVGVNITRYFGGVMLGAGGLTRAYRESAAAAFSHAQLVEMRYYSVLEASLPYTFYDKLMRVISQNSYIIKNSNFGEIVSLDIALPFGNVDDFNKQIANLSMGSINITQKNNYYEPFLL